MLFTYFGKWKLKFFGGCIVYFVDVYMLAWKHYGKDFMYVHSTKKYYSSWSIFNNWPRGSFMQGLWL